MRIKEELNIQYSMKIFVNLNFMNEYREIQKL